MKQAINLLVVFNFIVLIGIVAGLGWLKKHGKLTENKLALILSGYFSFSFITTSLPLLMINTPVALIVDAVFLLILWSVGYLWIRWLYRKSNSSK